MKHKRVGRRRYEKLSNNIPVAALDYERDLDSLILHIVEEEDYRLFSRTAFWTPFPVTWTNSPGPSSRPCHLYQHNLKTSDYKQYAPLQYENKAVHYKDYWHNYVNPYLKNQGQPTRLFPPWPTWIAGKKNLCLIVTDNDYKTSMKYLDHPTQYAVLHLVQSEDDPQPAVSNHCHHIVD